MKNHLIFFLFLFSISCNKRSNEVIVTPVTPDKKVCKIVPKDGLLILEAENFSLKGSWYVREDAKASKGKYIEYIGANNYTVPNTAHEISAKFSIDTPSTYLVRWFMRQPDGIAGDLGNDAWIYFPGDIASATVNGAKVTLTTFEKFVSRGVTNFIYGGYLDLHNPKASSWMTVKFPAAGEYTLKISARSQYFQLDKLVLSSGMTDSIAHVRSTTLTETIKCE